MLGHIYKLTIIVIIITHSQNNQILEKMARFSGN